MRARQHRRLGILQAFPPREANFSFAVLQAYLRIPGDKRYRPQTPAAR